MNKDIITLENATGPFDRNQVRIAIHWQSLNLINFILENGITIHAPDSPEAQSILTTAPLQINEEYAKLLNINLLKNAITASEEINKNNILAKIKQSKSQKFSDGKLIKKKKTHEQ